jgi:hypothetical protein
MENNEKDQRAPRNNNTTVWYAYNNIISRWYWPEKGITEMSLSTQCDRCLSSTSRCLYSQGYSVCITRVMTVVIGWKIEVKRMKPSIAFHVLEKQEMGVSQQCYHCWIENDTYNSGMKDWSGLIPKCSQDAGYWLYTVEAPGHIPVKH